MTCTTARHSLILAAVLLVAAPLASRLSAQRDDGATPLEAGDAFERPLRPREQHRYVLGLRAGEYARVVVDQAGIDVVAESRGADGTTIAAFQDEIRSSGAEQVEIVANGSGPFDLLVRAARGFAGSGRYSIRFAERRLATEADRVLQNARALRTQALRLDEEGRFEPARAALEQALAFTEAVRGSDDVLTATAAAELAAVYRKIPDDVRSEKLFERALSILDRRLGPDFPTTAVVRSRLGQMYQRTGQRPKAEAALKQALDAIEAALGTGNRFFVSGLVTLANLHNDAGDLDQEEAVIQRALGILDANDDADSFNYAALLNNLGEVYRRRNDSRAEATFEEALSVGARLLGPENFYIATNLQNLGIMARERKDYAAAESYYTRALSIRERVVGPAHPDIAPLLNNLAAMYRAKGDVERSLQTHLRALAIWERSGGPYQDATLVSVGNLARTYAEAGDYANAVAYQRRADTILEKQLELNVAIGSERQKLAFVRTVSERTHRTISLHLLQSGRREDAGALAALVVLQRKGRVQDAMADTFAAVRQHDADPRNHATMDRLKEVTARLARAALTSVSPAQAAERQSAVKSLEAEKELLEAELSAHSAAFRAQAAPVTLDAVQAAIPGDAALVEYVVFRPFDPRAERNADAYGPLRYAAYVLRAHGAPRGFDLGPADAINLAVDALRVTLRDPAQTGVARQARAVAQLVFAPLRGAIGDATRLLVSPDGQLNLVPFDALADDRGRYLVERFAVSYLTSGRDLLRMRVARASRSRAVVFADPLFGEPARTGAPRPPARASTIVRSVTTGRDLSSMYFAPLAATGDEARAIKSLFPEATLYTGGGATKATLQRVQAPRMLHIASHGFFLQDPRQNAENPLLRSGIALAGANGPHATAEDGILTALEASALDLWGTKLVTLSACDTGVGEIRNGEGVYGLRRAFVLAGAETMVMSLWPVSDAIARETMVSYYTSLRDGLGRGDALRDSKLKMLKQPSRRHPYYWASFIQSGDWSSLDDAR